MGNPKDKAGSQKVPLRFVPPSLLIQVAGPLSQGADKYGSYDWRKDPISLTLHLEAVERHLAAYKDGEDKATDSGFSHLAHAAATLGVIMDAEAFGTLIDDRTKGPAGKLLEGSITEVPAPEDMLPLNGISDAIKKRYAHD